MFKSENQIFGNALTCHRTKIQLNSEYLNCMTVCSVETDYKMSYGYFFILFLLGAKTVNKRKISNLP